ncbi:hypothetical protein ABBQ32_004430 [Trebouxia sp. C0010 RCD-2024]
MVVSPHAGPLEHPSTRDRGAGARPHSGTGAISQGFAAQPAASGKPVAACTKQKVRGLQRIMAANSSLHWDPVGPG